MGTPPHNTRVGACADCGRTEVVTLAGVRGPALVQFWLCDPCMVHFVENKPPTFREDDR